MCSHGGRAAIANTSEIVTPGASKLAYERFKSAMLNRLIAPDTHITQSELVILLGTPLGALREALVMLQTEGVLTIKPRSGIYIHKSDLRMVRNSYQMRFMIEGTAIRLFAAGADIARLAEMRKQQMDWLERIGRDGPSPERTQAFLADDQAWHREIVDFLDNPLASRAHTLALEHIAFVRADLGAALSDAMARNTVNEHLAILKACEDRDCERAAEMLDTHFRNAVHRVIGL